MKLRIFWSMALLCLFSNAFSQVKTLTKAQMLADFDQLVDHINSFAVHKDLNKVRLAIDYEKEYAGLRQEITDETSPCEFYRILQRAAFFVQDGHCLFMPFSYLEAYGKYQRKFNFPDDHTYEAVKSYEDLCGSRSVRFHLPLLYNNGKYIFYADVIHRGDTLRTGTEITAYNGRPISTFIRENYDQVWTVKWDQELRQPYHLNFYMHGEEDFELEFSDDRFGTRKINLQDSVDFPQELLRTMSYSSQQSEQVLYFEDHATLYIGLSFMDVAQSKRINAKVDSLTAIYKTYEKVIVDIRGNPGGSDVTWRNVISHLISKPVPFETNLKYKYHPDVLGYYAKGKKKEETIPLLDNAAYWTQEMELKKLKPSRKSIRHAGKVFVLQDSYIYSSAGNFSNFCFNSDQLVSVGMATDLVGGMQTDPLFFKLSHSELVFRVEPMLDFSGVKTIDGFAHNAVEIPLNYSPEDLLKRSTYDGYIYSKEFLLEHDPFIAHILKLD